jgi:hypothetical protein
VLGLSGISLHGIHPDRLRRLPGRLIRRWSRRSRRACRSRRPVFSPRSAKRLRVCDVAARRRHRAVSVAAVPVNAAVHGRA